IAVSITPVVIGAAINGPPPPAPSMYRKAICLPSCDQRGRATYPFRLVFFFAPEPSAFKVQSCRWSFWGSLENFPAFERNASVFESGDQAGSKSVLSPPVIGRLISLAGAFPEISRMYVSFVVDAAVDCTHARCVPSGERAMSPYKTVFPNCSV